MSSGPVTGLPAASGSASRPRQVMYMMLDITKQPVLSSTRRDPIVRRESSPGSRLATVAITPVDGAIYPDQDAGDAVS